MSARNSPGIRKPYLPLRGRSKRVPTKRVFTFTQAWTNSETPVNQHAEVTKMLGGRGEIIRVTELSSAKSLSKHVEESPVPLIITSPVPQIIPQGDDDDDDDGEEEEEEEEEMEVEEGDPEIPETRPSVSPTPDSDASSVPQSVTGSIQEGINVEEVTLKVHNGRIQPAKDKSIKKSPQRQATPKKTRSFAKAQDVESEESDAESELPPSQPQFDDRIEAGHFANSRLELSRISHAGGDYRRQRHSTPIPSSRTRTFLDTVVPTPRPNQSERSSPVSGEEEQIVPSPRSLKKRSTKDAIPASPAKKATPAKSAKDSSMSKSRLSTSRRSPRIAELSTHEEEPIITPTTSKKSNMTDNRRSLFAPPASASPSLKKKPSKGAPNRNKSVDRLKAQSTLDSFISATPRSARPIKPTTKRQKAPVEPVEVSDDMPNDVRVWQDGISKRSLSDITDLDVVLERLEEVAWNIKDQTEDKVERRAINRLMVKTQEDIRQTIAESHNLKKLKSSVTKSSSIVRKKRKDLLELQINNAKLRAEVQKKKKQVQQVPYRDPKTMKEISDFLTKLSSLNQNLAKSSKQPKRSPKKFVVYGRSKEADSSIDSQSVRRRLYLRE